MNGIHRRLAMGIAMLKEYPLVSIVTPSYNQGHYIEETIRSVLDQGYPNLEYIIVDGGSTDNTIEILKRYEDRVIWFSEKDQGQADAVNKAFRMAKGEILGWLNSDDIYTSGALNKVGEHFLKYPEILVIYGEAYFIDRDGKVIGKYPTEPFVLKRLADTSFICQPTLFMRAEVFEAIGMLDTNLHTCMDYDYWIRIGRYYPVNKIFYLKGIYLASSRMYNQNKTVRMRKKVYQEVMKTQKKYFGKYSKKWIRGYLIEIILGKRIKLSP